MKVINLDKLFVRKLTNNIFAMTTSQILNSNSYSLLYYKGEYYNIYSINILHNQSVILSSKITSGQNNSDHDPVKIEEFEHVGTCPLCDNDILDLVNMKCCKCLVKLKV